MPLKTAASRVRAAIEAGNHTLASHLLEDFGQAAECAWRDAISREQRQAVAQEVNGLLHWARETVLVSRSHQQGKLLQFKRAGAYLSSGSGHGDRLELDA